MAGTISQRISLEGSEDIRKKLEALGTAGVQAFKQIQDAAKQPITDPGQIDKTKQALDQLAATTTKLGPQFQALAQSTRQFGSAGAEASQQVAAGLNQTEAAAKNASASLAQAAGQARSAGENAGAGLISAANAFKIAAVGIVAAIAAISDALVKGTVETGTKIAEQAEKLKLTTAQWVELRKGIASAGLKSDEFVSATSKIGAAMEKAKGGVATLTNGLREQAVQTQNGIVTIMSFGNASGKAETDADKYATTLRRLGVSWETIMSGDTNAALREAAQNIKAIDNETERTKAGLERFGKNWEKIVAVLTGTQKIDPLKAGRELLPEQIEKTVTLKEKWEDLEQALRATRDQIGALFLDSSLTRTEWLTALVDGSRELFKVWSGLSTVDKGAFLAGLGDGAAEQVFKVLIALGEQLGGIWRDALVPAGEALLEMFSGIADNFEGVTKSQVAAFFITAAIAAVGLAVALKGIALVLSPLAALLSFAFSPLGMALIAAAAAAALFWDQLKEGANSVLAMLPEELKQVQEALQLLFKGDFAGAWDRFSQAAVSAFAKIKEAFLSSDFGAQVLLTVGSLVAAFIGLRRAAGGVVTALGIVAVAQYTGALQALTLILQAFASIAIIAGVATRGIVGALVLFATAIGAGPAAIALLATALAGLIVYLDPGVWAFYANAATGAFAIIAPLVTPITEAIRQLSSLVGGEGSSAWDIFRNAAMSALNPIYGAVQAILNLIELVKRGLASLPSKGPAGSVSGSATGSPGPFARGGLLGGRGTGTSDSNLAWLSRGEYIMPARAVAQPGVLAFLEALRRSGKIPGFAAGGRVPGFAAGGLVGGAAASVIDNIVESVNEIDRVMRSYSVSLLSNFSELSGKMADIQRAIIRQLEIVNNAVGVVRIFEPVRKAGGGLLGGRGTGTSDSNLAWLSRGEHIMPARAVRQPGVLAFLEALRRSGGNLSRVLDDMGRFALGGMVPRAIPAFATGGLAGGMSNVTIAFPGLPPISGLRASSDVVDQLHKAAALAQVRSGGRKPSRYS